jgi:hypothetical protein
MDGKARLPLGSAWGCGEVVVEEMAGALVENVFTGERIAVGQDGRIALKALFAEFPVGLFVRE